MNVMIPTVTLPHPTPQVSQKCLCFSDWLLCLSMPVQAASPDVNEMEMDPLISKPNPILGTWAASCRTQPNKDLSSVSLPISPAATSS
ncbi:hypothetical protein SK128_018463 [Halocaridina rubra]|uniref:Uncharacterized protein n=1 Tax=Halocaridina rubra TaxID=373956 RepID=A0AAN9A8J1_HALRR